MGKNKTGTYLKYAFGEIILVVIGILIALQINNWNEQRKRRIEYISDLKTIKENLKNDAQSITSNLKNGNRYAKDFKDNLAADSLIIDGSSILFNIGIPILSLEDNGYQTAKRKNTLNLIQNDSLKILFHEYYVRQIGIAQQYANTIEQIGTVLKTYYLESGHQRGGVSNKDIMTSLMKEAPFIDYLNMYMDYRETTLERFNSMIEVNTKLIKTINMELKQLE